MVIKLMSDRFVYQLDWSGLPKSSYIDSRIIRNHSIEVLGACNMQRSEIIESSKIELFAQSICEGNKEPETPECKIAMNKKKEHKPGVQHILD